MWSSDFLFVTFTRNLDLKICYVHLPNSRASKAYSKARKNLIVSRIRQEIRNFENHVSFCIIILYNNLKMIKRDANNFLLNLIRLTK